MSQGDEQDGRIFSLMEECPDETLVAPWHWTDRNAFQWSKNKLSELLVGMEIKTDLGAAKITEITKCKGDAVVYNRKNDFKHFYEIHLEMKWIGTTNYGTVVEGRVTVPYLSEECGIEETDVTVQFVEDGAESSYFGNIMKLVGTQAIKQQLSVYVKALKHDFPRNPTIETELEMEM